jgi:hypothetical protein
MKKILVRIDDQGDLLDARQVEPVVESYEEQARYWLARYNVEAKRAYPLDKKIEELSASLGKEQERNQTLRDHVIEFVRKTDWLEARLKESESDVASLRSELEAREKDSGNTKYWREKYLEESSINSVREGGWEAARAGANEVKKLENIISMMKARAMEAADVLKDI